MIMTMTAEALENWARKHQGPIKNNAVVSAVYHVALRRALEGEPYTYEEYMDFMVQHLIAAQEATSEQYGRHMQECVGSSLFSIKPIRNER